VPICAPPAPQLLNSASAAAAETATEKKLAKQGQGFSPERSGRGSEKRSAKLLGDIQGLLASKDYEKFAASQANREQDMNDERAARERAKQLEKERLALEYRMQRLQRINPSRRINARLDELRDSPDARAKLEAQCDRWKQLKAESRAALCSRNFVDENRGSGVLRSTSEASIPQLYHTSAMLCYAML
jgi:hypothetical protein